MGNDEFNVEDTLNQLTLPEKIKLLTGQGWWHTESIPRVGIQSMRLSDGPNGARGTRFFNGVPSSCLPASSGLGSSFDVELARKVGEALGDECRAKSVHVSLAPTVNIQRSPLGGRGFESFSEDPYLNGTIAAAYINGLQSKGVSSTIKHFVANDQEFERFSISSDVSERALREIYLKPFQIAIKESNPWALMSAYNRVNGLHVSENKRLLTDILRNEWGFKGTIISDWIGVYSTTGSIKAGLDLEMPGPSVMRGKAVERALIAQKLTIKDIDERVIKILELYKHAEASGIPFDGPEGFIDTPKQRQVLRTAAADTIVLLKNEKGLLPLSAQHSKKIAVIGPNAKYGTPSGGGSASLRSTYTVSPLEGITEAAKEIGAEVTYAIGATSHKYLPVLDPFIRNPQDGNPGALVQFWNAQPSDDFLADKVDNRKTLPKADWSTATYGTNCLMADGIDDTKVNTICWIRYSTKFIPDEDGDYDIGMSIAGSGNLYVDGQLTIDLRNSPPGGTFFGLGSPDVRTVLKGLKKNEEYALEVRIANKEFIERGPPFICWGGVRLGGIKQVDADAAIKEAVELAEKSDVAIVIVGLNGDWETEGNDRCDMELPGSTNRLVAEVLKANTSVVVVNQTGTPVRMPWVHEAHTLVQDFYGGNELGNGLADILFGKVNPSAKLSITFPKRLEDSPSYPSFSDKGQEAGKILYNEGIFVGYRGYEIRNLEPLFPFGHGLSYSDFEYSALEVSSVTSKGEFSVSFTVANKSTIDGREVVQVYITDPESTLPKAVKELKGFAKIALRANEHKTTKIELNRDALAYYDEQQGCWVAEKGVFRIAVGASLQDIRLKIETVLEETFTWRGL
ncbi:glycoside hydrolase family 3 protein [Crepidotus variabilis]|uniref:beta-glucosidase n=1 Tax=Crepidotus variabilis TaxID=179855 RepID=A0A9P6EFW9_9AGAR|nr:glycoside hydrolase family 3 protein [Crepidotus variabilis]